MEFIYNWILKLSFFAVLGSMILQMLPDHGFQKYVRFVLGLILTAGGILFSRKLLVMMNTPAEILDDAACYLRIYSYGLIFNVVYNMAAGILNAAGNSRRSLMYLAAAAVVNIFMDLLLIAGLKIGVAGAAIA